MADYRLAKKADQDLEEIYVFSYRNFGEAKADAYLEALAECFTLLAEQPSLGRRIDHIRPGYLRHEHHAYSIFFRREADGILIMRVLYKGRDMRRHL
jgi:toxin ParE1/3/4